MRLAAPVVLALALAALPGVSAKIPDSIAAPTYVVGDEWTIQAKVFTQTFTVIAVADGIVQIRITQKNDDGSTPPERVQHLRASDLAVVQEGSSSFTEKWHSPCVQNEWPLTVGKTWSSSCTGAYVYGDGRTDPASRSHTGKVVGTEDVTTPLGRFETMIVERKAGDFVTRQWIAPGQCAPVKETMGTPGEPPSDRTLKTSTCAGATAAAAAATTTTTAANRPPTVTCGRPTVHNGLLTVQFFATDPDGDEVSTTLYRDGQEIFRGTSGGLQTYDPTTPATGWTITANDGRGGVATAPCTDHVDNRPPAVACGAPEMTPHGVAVQWVVSDPDGDEVKVRIFHAGVVQGTTAGSGLRTFEQASLRAEGWEVEGDDQHGGIVRVPCEARTEAKEVAQAADEIPAPAAAGVLAALAAAVALRRRA